MRYPRLVATANAALFSVFQVLHWYFFEHQVRQKLVRSIGPATQAACWIDIFCIMHVCASIACTRLQINAHLKVELFAVSLLLLISLMNRLTEHTLVELIRKPHTTTVENMRSFASTS